MFRFLHTADVHLDSPLKGLEAYQDAPVDQIRSAVRRAFDNLVDFAIQEEAAFVLLAGDLFDGDWKDYNTGIYFINRMGLLRDAGIQGGAGYLPIKIEARKINIVTRLNIRKVLEKPICFMIRLRNIS